MRRTVALLVALTAGAGLAAADSGSHPSEVAVQSDGGKVGKALRSSDIGGFTGLYDHTYGPYASSSSGSSASSSSSSSYKEPPVSKATASILAALGLLLLGSAAVFAFSQAQQPGMPPRFNNQGGYGFGAYGPYGQQSFSPLGGGMGMAGMGMAGMGMGMNRPMTPYEQAQLMRKLEPNHDPIRQCASCCNGSSPTHMVEAPEPRYQMVHGNHSGKDLFEPEDHYRTPPERSGCCSRRSRTCCLLFLCVGLGLAGTLTLLATPGSPFFNEDVAEKLHTAHKYVNKTAHDAKSHCEETGLCDKAKELAHKAASHAQNASNHLAGKARNHLDQHGGEHWNKTKSFFNAGAHHVNNAANHAKNAWNSATGNDETSDVKEGFHRLVPACSLDSDQLLPWYGSPRWASPATRGGEVVCCNKEQTKVFRKEPTVRKEASQEASQCISGTVSTSRSSKPLKTYREAKDLCEFVDLVLCERTTLLDSACEKAECGYNRALTWLGGEPKIPIRDAGFGSMDCDEGADVWQTGWTIKKKAHCCIHGGTSCDEETSEELDFTCSVTDNSDWTAAEKAFCCRDGSSSPECNHQFVCDENEGWETEWSEEKKKYCCKTKPLLCSKPQASASAGDDLPKASKECSEDKCSHNGYYGSCAYHIQSIVTFHQAVVNCTEAWKEMILACPSCRTCNFEDSACQNARVAPPPSDGGDDDGTAKVV